MSTSPPADGRGRRRLAALAAGLAIVVGLAVSSRRPTGEPARSGEGRAEAPPSEPATEGPPLARLDSRPGIGAAPAKPQDTAAGAAPAATRPVVPRVRLRLVEADGTPVRGGHARLEGTLADESPRVGTDPVAVGDEGVVAFDVPQELSGTRVEVRLRRPGRAVARGDVDVTSAAEQVVRVGPLGDVRLSGVARRFEGIFDAGPPVPGLLLRIGRRAGHAWREEWASRSGHLMNEGPEAPFGSLEDDEVASVRTDAEGRFTVEGLASEYYRVVDVGPGWILTPWFNALHPKHEESTVLVEPARSVVVHVRSSADGRPVRPRSVLLERSPGGATTWKGPSGADFSVRWSASEASAVSTAHVTIEADGHFPERVVLPAQPTEPTTETTVLLRPLPTGPPGSLRLSVVTSDRAFLDGPFGMEVYAPRPPSPGRDGSAGPEAGDAGTVDLVVHQRTAVRDGHDLVFSGMLPGTWRVRVWTPLAAPSLAWDHEVSVPSGSEVPATWTVAPHGVIVFGKECPAGVEWTVEGTSEHAVVDGSGPAGTERVRVAVPPGSWTVSRRTGDIVWLDGDAIRIEDGEEHEYRGEATRSRER